MLFLTIFFHRSHTTGLSYLPCFFRIWSPKFKCLWAPLIIFIIMFCLVLEWGRFSQILLTLLCAPYFDDLTTSLCLFLQFFHLSHTIGLSYRPYFFRPNARKLKCLWASPRYNFKSAKSNCDRYYLLVWNKWKNWYFSKNKVIKSMSPKQLL